MKPAEKMVMAAVEALGDDAWSVSVMRWLREAGSPIPYAKANFTLRGLAGAGLLEERHEPPARGRQSNWRKFYRPAGRAALQQKPKP